MAPIRLLQRFYRPDEELARDLREAVKLAFDAGECRRRRGSSS